MPTPFCPGYAAEPYASLVRDYPGASHSPADATYPAPAFRTEWGPVFHRGRLDGTARLLAIGQDPAQHEVITRRILVGAAGKRVQGFMAKLGVTQSYVVLNAFLYSVYGQSGGAANIKNVAITEYRNRWFKAILDTNPIEGVVAFGGLAEKAWTLWLNSPDAAGRPALPFQRVPHPTSPISGSKGDKVKLATLTAQMLTAWNAAIAALSPAVQPDVGLGAPYGAVFTPDELPDIPMADLPAGTPPWMATEDSWANRVGKDAALKRRTIQIVVPKSIVL
jgi:hypothetical protein